MIKTRSRELFIVNNAKFKAQGFRSLSLLLRTENLLIEFQYCFIQSFLFKVHISVAVKIEI